MRCFRRIQRRKRRAIDRSDIFVRVALTWIREHR